MNKFKKYSGIILQSEDEILFCKRSPDKSMPNIWSIPSGKIEIGENPGQAAIREFYEETNIEIDNKINFVGFIDRFKENGIKKGHMFVFYKKTSEKLIPDLKNAKDGYEHTECKYFKQDKLPKQKENKELIKLVEKLID